MLVTLVLAAAFFRQPAGPGPSVTVLDRKLHQTTGSLLGVSKQDVNVRADGKDLTVRAPLAVVSSAAWTPDRDWPGATGPESSGAADVTVRLTDGSLLYGDLLAGKADGLVLVHRQLGKVEFPLDSLEALTVHADAGSPEAAGSKRAADTVRLVNGDRLEGFVESIAPAKEGAGAALCVNIEHDKAKTSVPLDRVAWVSLHGAGKARPATTVWLATGERTGALEVTADSREARIVREKGSLPATVGLDQLLGVLLDPAVAVPLAACAVRSGGTVETGPEQVLGTRDLTLPEPGQIAFELPKGARRISGWAVLPEECRRLGDCTVRITVAGSAQSREQTLLEFTLSGASPVVKIDKDFPADAASGAGVWLSVTVGEGKNGPVQDRVVLRRVLIGTGD
jgi:hypothetical protein